MTYVQQIEYARTPSHATLRHQDPNFVPPKLNQAMNAKKIKATGKVTVSHAENDQRKREREDDSAAGRPEGKKRREAEGDDMEVDEDDEGASKGMSLTGVTRTPHPRIFSLIVFRAATSNAQTAPPIPSVPLLPSAILLCQNLPAEVTDDVLAVLFQQYV
jgi:U2 small nuclear ribonucleoprotein B''